MTLLVIDNYDSFTYNLVHYAQELGAETKVVRNDDLSVERGAGHGRERHPAVARSLHAK